MPRKRNIKKEEKKKKMEEENILTAKPQPKSDLEEKVPEKSQSPIHRSTNTNVMI